MDVDLPTSPLTGLLVRLVEKHGEPRYLIRFGTPGGTVNFLANQVGAEELRRQLEAALFTAMIAGQAD